MEDELALQNSGNILTIQYLFSGDEYQEAAEQDWKTSRLVS